MSLVLLAVRWVVLRRRPWGWRLSSGEIASQSHVDCRAVAPWPSPQAGARGPVVTRERLPCAFTGRGREGRVGPHCRRGSRIVQELTPESAALRGPAQPPPARGFPS